MSSSNQEELIRVIHFDDEPDHMMISKRSLEKFDSAIQVVSVSLPIFLARKSLRLHLFTCENYCKRKPMRARKEKQIKRMCNSE